MKIGILTFVSGHNYGAVLQACALQSYLLAQEHEADIIDYRPTYLDRDHWPVPLPRLHGLSKIGKLLRFVKWLGFLPWTISILPWRVVRRRAFRKFEGDRLQLSPRYQVSHRSWQNYDAVIFGSDQIWNPEITEGGDPVFFGLQANGEVPAMIAYGASAGSEYETAANDTRITHALGNFSAVSVRESLLASALRPTLQQPVEKVLDPTMLVEPSLWDQLSKRPVSSAPYILLYEVEKVSKARKIAGEIAQKLSARVVSIWSGYGGEWPLRSIMTASPEEFVGWVKNAECIVTSSFHGVAMAVSLSKPFYCVSNRATPDVRIAEVLSSLSLEDRFIAGANTPPFSAIDYSQGSSVATNLKQGRKQSGDFLRKALANIRSVRGVEACICKEATNVR